MSFKNIIVKEFLDTTHGIQEIAQTLDGLADL